MQNWQAKTKNRFTVNQIVAYFIHGHSATTLCKDSKKNCLRKGVVEMVTYWRRGEEFAYRVSDQYGNFYWMRENFVYLPAEAEVEQKRLVGYVPFLRVNQRTQPNLQNIPIRTEIGRQIREAFVKPYREAQRAANNSL